MTGSNLVAGMLRFRIYISTKVKSRMLNKHRRVGDREKKRGGGTHLGIGITKFDSDVPYELVFESDGHDSRDGFYDCRFPMCDMSDRA